MATSPAHCLALFGAGRAGKIHFLNLVGHHRAYIKYLVEADLQLAQELVKTYRLNDSITVLKPEDDQQIFDDKSVTGVIVASPTFCHESTVRKALKHGKGVFCEKPIAAAYEDVEACYDEARLAGQSLLCSFNRRFDPTIVSVRDEVRAGKIGKVYTARTCSRDHPLPEMKFLKHSGGIFHDCGIHDIDYLCWVIGEFPVSVFTQAHCFDEKLALANDEDTVMISMKFPSGALGLIELSRHANYGYDQRFEVFGQKGMLKIENLPSEGWVSSNQAGITSQIHKWSFPQRYRESYINAIDHFLDVLDKKCEPVVKSWETLNAALIASKCEESLKLGEPVKVEIPASNSERQ